MRSLEEGGFDVERVRREFDDSFSRRALEASTHELRLLAIRVGDKPYALPVAEIGGVAAGVALRPLPSDTPALLGLAGIRGLVVPVFDLAALLGEPPSSDVPRWLVLAAGVEPLGFAFSALEGQLGVSTSALASSEERRVVTGVIRADGLRPCVGIARLVEEIRGWRGGSATGKEA